MKLHYVPKLKNFARDLRMAGNLAEVLLWKELKGKKLGITFLRQRPIGDYIVDFYCPVSRCAIEVDGVSHDAKVEKDLVRQQILESHGIRFLRFTDADVRFNLDSVLREIKSCINPPVHRNELPSPTFLRGLRPFAKEE